MGGEGAVRNHVAVEPRHAPVVAGEELELALLRTDPVEAELLAAGDIRAVRCCVANDGGASPRG